MLSTVQEKNLREIEREKKNWILFLLKKISDVKNLKMSVSVYFLRIKISFFQAVFFEQSNVFKLIFVT
jgi:hypothetical protein